MSAERILTEKRFQLTENAEVYTPLRSFRYGERVRFCVKLPAADTADTVVLRIHRDADGEMSLFSMTSTDGHAFSFELATKQLCADTGGGLFFYGYDVYFSDGCVTFGGEGDDVLTPVAESDKRQLFIYQANFHTPTWLRGGLIYHIFVDRFCRGGDEPLRAGAVWNTDWYNGVPQFGAYPGAPVDNNEFFGGDLYGVIEKLDYIASLGVTCIYLSPIFDAASNHKYDTGDYEHVDAMFGGDAALSALLQAAQKRNIRVILDGVFNHTGSDSRYFNQKGTYPTCGAAQSPSSPYYSWYTFSEYPQKYDCWWGVQILPKVNCDEPSYREYIVGENGIAARWMQMGISGWRLDVADELSDGFLDAFRSRVRSCDPDAVIYGEVWENATNKIAYGNRRRYLAGAQLDSVMNYPLRTAIISYIRDGEPAALHTCVQTVYRQYPKESADVLMNFLGTHDTARILTELGGASAEGHSLSELSTTRMNADERCLAVSRLRIAYQLLSVMPGVPCIFYGDEAGMEGYGDPFNRRPFPWGREDHDLTAFYRRIGAFHRAHPVLHDGFVKILYASSRALAVLRWNGRDEAILLLLNRSEHEIHFMLSESVRGADHAFCGNAPTLAPYSGSFYLSANDQITAAEI